MASGPVRNVLSTRPIAPLAIPGTGWNQQHGADTSFAKHLVSGTQQHSPVLRNLGRVNHTIFEGTSEIQQLVISRAISGLRIV